MKKFSECIVNLEEKGIASKGAAASFIYEFDVDLESDDVNDINTPLEPLDIKNEADIIKVQCGRCTSIFEKTPRCPECGQKILYV